MHLFLNSQNWNYGKTDMQNMMLAQISNINHYYVN